MVENLVAAFITLFVVVDPIALGPIFIGLTSGMPAATKRLIAIEASIIAFCVLAGGALFGSWLLAKLGITLAAFRIAGGLLLFAIAFEMVFERRQQRKADNAASATAQGADTNVAAFPLAIPLMAGPGAITAVVLLGTRAESLLGWALLIGTILVIVLMSFAVFLTSELLERLLGKRGQVVFGRLFGVLLAALAVQYVADGVFAFKGH
jgi:multiple antibiotic resistance protein